MARAAFTQQEVKRAVAGALAAGLEVNSVSIDPEGRIVVSSTPTVEDEQTKRRGALAEWEP